MSASINLVNAADQHLTHFRRDKEWVDQARTLITHITNRLVVIKQHGYHGAIMVTHNLKAKRDSLHNFIEFAQYLNKGGAYRPSFRDTKL